MYAGYAVGGPLNKVKLTANITWSGFVTGHEGRYRWDSVAGTWNWQTVEPSKPPAEARTPRISSLKPKVKGMKKK